MAWLFGDSFDFYAAVADMSAGHWDSVNATYIGLGSSNTRFGVGQSINRISGSTSNTALTKAFASNEATVFIALAFKQISALSGTTAAFSVALRDGSTNQCSIVFRSDGAILLTSGGPTGTTLATYSSAFAQNVWAHFQVKVVINNATGSITVRKDGATSDSFSATSLNTRGGTANNYANAVATFFGDSSLNQYVDDLLFYSGSGAAPNTWVGDIRAVQLMPTVDTAKKDFAPAGTNTNTLWSNSVNLVTRSTNTIYYVPFTQVATGTISKIGVKFNGAVTGHAKVALYDATGAGGTPGALVTTSAEVTNPLTGNNDFTFSSPPSVTAGTVYYAAILSDVAWNNNGQTALITMYTESRTYGSGFVSTATPSAVSTYGGQHIITTTLTNCYCVNEAIEDGDTTYVYDGTSGHEDLYDLADLSSTPTSIVGVVSKVFAKKSDSGSRQGQIRVKSGATEVGGTDTVLTTTYGWLNRVDTVDPNTSSAWTASAVNALQVGPKVTA